MQVKQERSKSLEGFHSRRSNAEVDIVDHNGYTWRLSLDIESGRAKAAAVRRFFLNYRSQNNPGDFQLVNVGEDLWQIKSVDRRPLKPMNLGFLLL